MVGQISCRDFGGHADVLGNDYGSSNGKLYLCPARMSMNGFGKLAMSFSG